MTEKLGVVAACLEQRSQAARPVGRDRDVCADVAPEPLGERAVVVPQAADVELHHEAVVAAHPRELVQHVRLEPPRVGVRALARERAREQRRRFTVVEARRVGARRRVVGRRPAERLERGAALGQHRDERRVVADLSVGDSLELGERVAPTGGVERDDRVGTEGRSDPARIRLGERAMVRER